MRRGNHRLHRGELGGGLGFVRCSVNRRPTETSSAEARPTQHLPSLYAPAAKIEAAARELEVWVEPRDSNEGGQWHDPLGVGPWKAAVRILPVPPDAPPETQQAPGNFESH